MADEQPQGEDPHWVKPRTVGQWAALLVVWGAGLMVWGIYLVAILYLFFKVFV